MDLFVIAAQMPQSESTLHIFLLNQSKNNKAAVQSFCSWNRFSTITSEPLKIGGYIIMSAICQQLIQYLCSTLWNPFHFYCFLSHHLGRTHAGSNTLCLALPLQALLWFLKPFFLLAFVLSLPLLPSDWAHLCFITPLSLPGVYACAFSPWLMDCSHLCSLPVFSLVFLPLQAPSLRIC